MRFIYQHASGVLVWLGPTSDNSDLGIDYLVEISDLGYDLELIEQNSAPTIYVESDSVKAVYDLLMRPYWTRLWIAQEVAVVHVEPSIGCGCRWESWSVWTRVMQYLFDYLTHLKIQVLEGKSFSEFRVVNDTKLALGWFRDLDDVRRKLHPTEEKSIQENSQRSNTFFTGLLHVTEVMLATDSRDRIYALLGLLSDRIEINILPDYIKPESSCTGKPSKPC